MLRALFAAAAAACASAPKAAPHKLSLFTPPGATRVDADATVTAAPAIVANGGLVRVTFSSNKHAASDVVAAYNDGDDVMLTAPIEYFPVPASYVETGTGALTFRALNNRAPWVFALVAGTTVRAVSSPVTFAAPFEPTFVRLAVTGDAASVRVSWTGAASGGAPRVTFWRADGGGANVTVAADSSTGTRGDFCGPPATTLGYRDAGVFHSAVLAGLAPGAAYAYIVGDDAAQSRAFNFTHLPTAAASPAALYPFGIAALGDMGELTLDGSEAENEFPPAPNTTRLMAADVASGRARSVLHCGDVSYARGYESSWEVFADLTSAITPFVTYNVDLGNHERDAPNSVPPSAATWGNGTDSGGECGVATARRFRMPGAGSDTQRLFWAAATGPFFQIHFSTEIDFATGSEAWKFVRDALAGVDRAATPFVIVAFHRPMYISSTNFEPGSGDQFVAAALREHIEPLLMAAHVDVVLAGHHHSYQRMSAVFNSSVVTRSVLEGGAHVYHAPAAPVYFDIGTGGAGFSTNIQTPPPPYAEVVSFAHGFARITAHNATALEWQFIDDATGDVADHAWILKA
jgi:hypothetical protein